MFVTFGMGLMGKYRSQATGERLASCEQFSAIRENGDLTMKWIVTYTEKKYENIEAGSAAGARRGFLENHTIRIDGNAYPDNSLKILKVQELERCPAGKHWTIKGTKCMACELMMEMGAKP